MKPKSCMALSTSCQCPIRTRTSGPSQAAVITLQLFLWPEVTIAHARKQALKSPLFCCTMGIRVFDNPIWGLCHWNQSLSTVTGLVVKQGKTIISYPITQLQIYWTHWARTSFCNSWERIPHRWAPPWILSWYQELKRSFVQING